jgi:hypothetical protein
MWTLEEIETQISRGDGREFIVKPGSGYPAGYVGTKYSIRRVPLERGTRYSFSLKSYAGNFVEATALPRNLMATIHKYQPGFLGTLRIRWNGDTILAPRGGEPPVYLGKMTYGEGAESLFPGLNLKQSSGQMCLYAGPQSALDIGEPWSVPARGHIRPKLTRRFRVDGYRERINTQTEHLRLTDYTIQNLEWNGKRFYVTNFGQVVSPITITHMRLNRLDLKQEVEKLVEQGLDTAVRFAVGRIERTHASYGRPWVMFYVGHIDDFVGPHPDLSTGPEYDLSDENVRSEEGD